MVGFVGGPLPILFPCRPSFLIPLFACKHRAHAHTHTHTLTHTHAHTHTHTHAHTRTHTHTHAHTHTHTHTHTLKHTLKHSPYSRTPHRQISNTDTGSSAPSAIRLTDLTQQFTRSLPTGLVRTYTPLYPTHSQAQC